MCFDVGNTPDESLDWADGKAVGFVMDDVVASSILLVVNCEGGRGAVLGKDLTWEGRVQDVRAFPESNILDAELDSAAAVFWVVVGILSNSEEIEECNYA